MTVRSKLTVVMLATAVVGTALLAGGCGSSSDQATGRGGDGPQRQPSTAKVDQPISARVFASTVRVTPATRTDDGRAAIDLHAARGESEGAQVIVEGSDRAAVGRMHVSASIDGFDPHAVRVLLEQPIRVTRSSPHGSTGTWYDALIPAGKRAVSIRAGRRLVIWLDVAVAESMRPATYTGAMRLTHVGSGHVAARIPIRVTVEPVRLPRVPTLASTVGIDASQLARFERVAAGSVQLRRKLDEYFATLAAARLSPGDPNVDVPGSLPSAKPSPDDAAFIMRTATRRGVSTFRIPFYMTYPFADPLGADRAAAIRYLRTSAAWLRERGLLERSFVYVIDEPQRGDEGRVRELRELVRAADPQLRLLVTIDPRPAFRRLADIFVANIGTGFRPADVPREHRAGAQLWVYPSISTWVPYPTLFIDDARASPRALAWVARRYGVDGLLYWSATHWHEVDDPYRDAATYREPGGVGNGDGTLLYPGRPAGVDDGPVVSVRLLQLRDGIEDADLMALAARRGARGAAVAADVARTLAPSQTTFTSDGDVVARQRARLFRILQ